MPGGTIGIVSPKILFAAPPQYSNTLATMSISARAALIGLPPLRASSRASSSCRSRIRNDAFVRTRPRSRALVRGHAPSSNARSGDVDRAAGVLRAGLGDLRHRLGGRRLDDIERLPLGGGRPLAAQDQQFRHPLGSPSVSTFG